MKTKEKIKLELLIGDPVMATIQDAPKHLKVAYKNEDLKLAFFTNSTYGSLESEGVPCIRLDDNHYCEIPPIFDEKVYKECQSKFDDETNQPIDGIRVGGSGSGKSFYTLELIKGTGILLSDNHDFVE